MIEEASYLQIEHLIHTEQTDLLQQLDRGEAEAIRLALRFRAQDHLLILDERLGRIQARRLGLTITGSLGVLLRAKQSGLISSIKPLIDQLLAKGFYLSPVLVQRVLEVAGE